MTSQGIRSSISEEDFLDSYMNLSGKSDMILQWMTMYCPNALFAIKVDDDAFVNYGQVLELLRKTDTAEKTIMGYYAIEEKLQHVKGLLYIISGILIPELYKASLVTPLYWAEDVYTTGWLAKNISNVKFVSIRRRLHSINEIVNGKSCDVDTLAFECQRDDCEHIFQTTFSKACNVTQHGWLPESNGEDLRTYKRFN